VFRTFFFFFFFLLSPCCVKETRLVLTVKSFGVSGIDADIFTAVVVAQRNGR
jgi:hypothetical protein